MTSRSRISVVHQGFTLLEMSIVLLIIGLVISGGLSIMTGQDKVDKYAQTWEKMKDIDDAIAVYLNENDALPCPAPLNAVQGSAEYGRASDCDDDTPPAGTYRVEHPASSGTYVRIGGVPFYDLEMQDEYLGDAWNSRLVYVVAEDLVTATDSDSTGIITIQDSTGDIETEAAWVLMSAGKNRNGAYSARSGVQTSCSSALLDDENCAHDDGIFLDTAYNDGDTPANYFDDLIRWETVPRLYNIQLTGGGGGGGGGGSFPTCNSGETIAFDGTDWVCAIAANPTGGSGPAIPTDVKVTTASHDGNFGGWSGLRTFMDANGCEGYELCHSLDLRRHMADNGGTPPIMVSAWIYETEIYTTSSSKDSCNQWTTNSSSSSYFGQVWSTSWLHSSSRYCDDLRPVACCKFGSGGGGGAPAGTTVASLPTCASGEVLEFDGTNWDCGTDDDTEDELPTCTADEAIFFDGTDWICGPTCTSNQILEFNGTDWACIATPSGGGGGGGSGLIPTSDISSNYTASSGDMVILNLAASDVTISPPSSPSPGDQFAVYSKGSAGGIATIDFGAANVEKQSGYTQDIFVDGSKVYYTYVDSTVGWIIDNIAIYDIEGEATFTSVGTRTWYPPGYLIGENIIMLAVGGGGGGANQTNGGGGGGGGALAYRNSYTVTSTDVSSGMEVRVGGGGSGGASGSNGGYSRIRSGSGTTLIQAGGGSRNAGSGGSCSGSGVTCGQGGWGGSRANWNFGGGGGGAGGYGGSGGSGGSYDGSNGWNGGGGGGGGGGQYGNGGTGGGVGIFGRGTNGAGGTYGGYGKNGGGGGHGSDGTYGRGGGAGAGGDNGRGGSQGAVRIIWGAGRMWPNTNVDEQIGVVQTY